jgi:SAM-dependent methyltransferase
LIQLVKDNFEISKKSKVLSVGPRFESELYGLRGLGFKWRNINAVDTYSYSPRISLGNMHNLVFKNKTFDLVVAGWVTAYSSDPIKAIIEFHIVLKPNGMAIITWELPMQYKIGGFKDFSLVCKKTKDDDYKFCHRLVFLIY